MPAALTECLFCGVTGQKVTNAHLVGEAILDALPPIPEDVQFARQILSLDATRNEWVEIDSRGPPSPYQTKVRVLCDECNGHWMADFERQVLAIIKRMQEDPTARLTKPDVRAVATWGTIVSVLSQQLAPDLDAMSKVRRRSLRTRSRPPDGFQVWVAHSADRPYAVWGLIHQFNSAVAMGTSVMRIDQSLFALIVGPLALLVLDSPRPGSLTTRPANSLRRIWPSPQPLAFVSRGTVNARDLENIRAAIVEELTGTTSPPAA